MSQPEDPIQTIRLSDRDKKKMVEEINSTNVSHGGGGERRALRVDYNIGSVVVLLTHPNGSLVKYSVVPRNLSGKGMGFLHGQFLHVGSACSVLLPTLRQGAMKVPGRIARCRHLKGLMHEVSVQFEEGIDLLQFVRLGTDEEAKARHELDVFHIGRVVMSMPDAAGCRVKYSLVPRRLNTTEVSVIYCRPLDTDTPVEVVFTTTTQIRLRTSGRVLTCTPLAERVYEVLVGFNVPVHKQDLEPNEASGDADAGEPLAPPAGSVLVVDDFESDRKLIRLWLGKMGMTVTEAADSASALAAVAGASHGASVIMQDLVLGTDSGVDVIRQVRAKGYRGLILAMSADDRDANVAAALAAGANGFVAKPTDAASLSQALAQLLNVTLEEPTGNSSEPIKSAMSEDIEMRPLVEAFVGQMAAYVEKLAALQTAGDFEGAARLCFQLKGAGGSHGFAAISKLAKLAMDRLQEPQHDLDAIRRTVDDLIAVLNRATV